MNKYDNVMIQTAILWSNESYCTRKKVGAVLSKDGRILATGYNGTVPTNFDGYSDCVVEKGLDFYKSNNPNEIILKAMSNNLTKRKYFVTFCTLHNTINTASMRAQLLNTMCQKCKNTKFSNNGKKTQMSSERLTNIKDKFISKLPLHIELTKWTRYSSVCEFKCSIHGVFNKIPQSISRQSYFCNECAKYAIKTKSTKPKQKYIQECKKIHGDECSYDKTEYINNKTKVLVTHKRYGDFWIDPIKHLSGRTHPKCKMSQGERKVERFLKNNNIPFTYNSNIKGYGRPNFYLYKHDVIIEYNGLQHYEFVEMFHINENGWKYQQQRDNLKRKFCKDNNIKLVEIPYNESVEQHLSFLILGVYNGQHV